MRKIEPDQAKCPCCGNDIVVFVEVSYDCQAMTQIEQIIPLSEYDYFTQKPKMKSNVSNATM